VSRDDAKRVEDIFEAIEAITYRAFMIGEATKRLSPEAKGAHPNVPWSNIAKMRDLIGHHYYRRDPEIIFATIREPLTQLRAACEQIAVAARDQTDTGN